MPGAAAVDQFLDGLEDHLFDDGLVELERRHALERMGRIAADIEIDIADKGPLFQYLQGRRASALESLWTLVGVDPKDAVEIAKAQAAVNEFLTAAGWIRARREEAEQAAQTIKEDYSPDGKSDRDE